MTNTLPYIELGALRTEVEHLKQQLRHAWSENEVLTQERDLALLDLEREKQHHDQHHDRGPR